MRRDLELAHKVLRFVEQNGSRIFKGAITIDGYERDAVIDHLYLLSDAGFITLGKETIADKGQLVMTWKGCDYMDEIRAKEARAHQDAKTAQRLGKPAAQQPRNKRPAAGPPATGTPAGKLANSTPANAKPANRPQATTNPAAQANKQPAAAK